MKAILFAVLGLCAWSAPLFSFVESHPESVRRWYLELKPGYFYFTESLMQQFFNNGGFVIRGEAGYKVWRPVHLWLEGSYFGKKGKAIGGDERIRIMLGTLTFGLKGIFTLHEKVCAYAGVGPRLFLLVLHNDSLFVRGEDSALGIGGGFTGGFWFFPLPKHPNLFFDLFADYSLRKLDVEEDPNSSLHFDVDASGISAGIGLGARF